MPTLANKAREDEVRNRKFDGAIVGQPIVAVSVPVDAHKVVMEELRQRLHSLEEKQTNTEVSLQDLRLQLLQVKTCQQTQQESMNSWDQVYRELQAASAIAPYAAPQSVEGREAVGVTVGILEAEVRELYVFKKSIWDIAIFIGTPWLGIGDSCITAVLLLVNVIMQTVFLGMAWFNFREAAIDETTIEAASRWRRYHGHDHQTMDALSGYSLVTRVCQNDQSLQLASTQAVLYESVRQYVKPGATGLEAIFVGKMLCVVALICWLLMVSKEVHNAVDLLRAMMHLDRSIDRLVPVESLGVPKRYEVASVSWKRLVFSVIIVGYRLVISALLSYCGIFFLVNTIDITELVLNAVALDVILNIDELLFGALITASARHLMLKLEPLCMPRWPHRRGMDLKTMSMAMIISSTVVIVYCLMVSPMVEHLKKVADALCSGTPNFVYADDALKMTIFAETNPCTNGCKMPMGASTSVKSLAAQEAVEHGHQKNSEYAIWVRNYHDLHLLSTLSFHKLLTQTSGGVCVDSLHGPYLHYMRQVMGNSSISTCSDVKHWCSSASFEPEWGPDGGKGLMARRLCPRTCECDNPGGGQIFITGCPTACAQKAHSVYAQHLAVSNGTCLQRSRNDLISSSSWTAWVAQVRQFASFRKDIALQQYSNEMAINGCSFVYSSSFSRRCIWIDKLKTVFKGLAFFCPDSCYCYCTSLDIPACPDPCRPDDRRRHTQSDECRTQNSSSR